MSATTAVADEPAAMSAEAGMGSASTMAATLRPQRYRQQQSERRDG